ncbi:transforming growth factor beta regulator [Pycnococcus provasolii]
MASGDGDDLGGDTLQPVMMMEVEENLEEDLEEEEEENLEEDLLEEDLNEDLKEEEEDLNEDADDDDDDDDDDDVNEEEEEDLEEEEGEEGEEDDDDDDVDDDGEETEEEELQKPKSPTPKKTIQNARWRNSVAGSTAARRGLLSRVVGETLVVKSKVPPSPLRDPEDAAMNAAAEACPELAEMERNAALMHDELRASCQSMQLAIAVSQRRWKLDALGYDPTVRNVNTTADLPRRRLPWNATEKEWLRRALLLFGLERWDALRAALTRGSNKPTRHALGDVADCAWDIVRSAATYASDPKERAYLERRVREGPPQSSDCRARFGVWDKADRLAGVWARRLILLDELHEVVAYLCDPRMVDYRGAVLSALRAIEKSNPPAKWWTRDADVALLMGVHKHGYAYYDRVRTDPEFQSAFGGLRVPCAAMSNIKSDAAAGGADADADADVDADADADTVGGEEDDGGDGEGEPNAGAEEDDAGDGAAKKKRVRTTPGSEEWPVPDTVTRRLKRLLDHAQRASAKMRKGKIAGVTLSLLAGTDPRKGPQVPPPPPPGSEKPDGRTRVARAAREDNAPSPPKVPPTAHEKLRLARALIERGVPRTDQGAPDYDALNAAVGGNLKGGAGAAELAHRALLIDADEASKAEAAAAGTLDALDDATLKSLEEKGDGDIPKMSVRLGTEMVERIRFFDGVRGGVAALDSAGGGDPFWNMLTRDPDFTKDTFTSWLNGGGDRRLCEELMEHGYPTLPGWRESVWADRSARTTGLGAMFQAQAGGESAPDAPVPGTFPSEQWLVDRSKMLSKRLMQHAMLVAQESGSAAAAAAVAGGASLGSLLPPAPVKRKVSAASGGTGGASRASYPRAPKAPPAGGQEDGGGGGGGAKASGAAVNPNPIQWLRPPKRVKYAKKTDVDRGPDGKPVYPIRITDRVTIESLGEIVWERDSFHNERHIFPVGYKSSREFASRVDPNGRTYYDSEILDGGDTPLFRVTPRDAPHLRVERESASGVWVAIANAVNAIRGGQRSKVTVSGTEMYGLSHPLVSILIQELPGVERLRKFKPQISFASQELPTGFWRGSAASQQAAAPGDGAAGAGGEGGEGDPPPPPPSMGAPPPPPVMGGPPPPPPSA